MENRIKYSKTFLLGFGFFAILLYETLYDNAVPLMLEHFTKSNTLIGFIMTFDNYIALLLVPAIGFYSDRLNTRFGKRIPFIMVGMPLAAFFIFLLPNYIGFGSLIALIIIANFSMSLFRSPVIALMPDITYSQHRGKANAIINFVGGFGAVAATLLGMKLFGIKEQYPFYLTSGLILVAFIIIFISIKEKRDVIEYEKQEQTGSIVKNLVEGFRRKEVFYMLLAICFWFIAYNGIKSFFSRYGIHYLGITEAESGVVLTFMSLPFLLFALPAGFIGFKFGQKRTMLLGLVGVLIAMVLLFLNRENINMIKYSFLLLGISWSFVNINSFPFVANLAPAGKIGVYTGLYYLFSTLANILAPVLLGAVLDTTVIFYENIWWPAMFIFSGFFFALALFFLSRVKVSNNTGA